MKAKNELNLNFGTWESLVMVSIGNRKYNVQFQKVYRVILNFKKVYKSVLKSE